MLSLLAMDSPIVLAFTRPGWNGNLLYVHSFTSDIIRVCSWEWCIVTMCLSFCNKKVNSTLNGFGFTIYGDWNIKRTSSMNAFMREWNAQSPCLIRGCRWNETRVGEKSRIGFFESILFAQITNWCFLNKTHITWS